MTGFDVYKAAILLMDAQDQTTGEVKTEENRDYQNRAAAILNTIIPRLAPYSDRSGGMLVRLEQAVPLDDIICASALPLYLAAQLLSEEDPNRSERFMNQYREAVLDIRSKIPAEFEQIRPAYGLF